jgi:glycosyltransferase involved in cell wall biosynthesis
MVALVCSERSAWHAGVSKGRRGAGQPGHSNWSRALTVELAERSAPPISWALLAGSRSGWGLTGQAESPPDPKNLNFCLSDQPTIILEVSRTSDPSQLDDASTPTKTVLWLSKGLGKGGMEQLLLNHARAADRAAFSYRAAYLVDRPHSVVDDLRDEGVPVRRLGSGRITDPRWVLDLLTELQNGEVDVLHVHSPLPGSIARVVLAVTRRRVKVVVTEHNRWDRYARLTRWVNRATFGLNDAALAVSADCRSTMPPKVQTRVRVLEHGIDADVVLRSLDQRQRVREELGIADDAIVVGTVANLREQKNYPLMLATAKQVLAEHPNVVFLAVGQGPLAASLNQRHDELGLGDLFRFLGFRSDATDVMAALDVFMLSSHHEGLPVALMEAMTLGLPIVSTEVGGIPEMVTDDREGRLVPDRSELELAQALTEVIGDAALRSRYGAQSRATALERFSAAAATAEIEDIYRELLDR